MKHTILTTILFIALLSCKAQSPIVAIDASRSATPDGAYFKDLDNEFNKFEGTWLFSNASDSFTMVLQKKELIFNGDDYEDELYGEYRYVENGVETVNTLPSLTTNPNDLENRNIIGGTIISNDEYLECDDCSINERRIMLYFFDPERDYLSVSIVLRYITGSTSPEQIKATVFSTHGSLLPNEDSPTMTRVPYGEYLMNKQ